MKKFGKRLLAAVVVSSMVTTPVLAAPSVDDLKKEKSAAQSEVNSLQSQLTEIVDSITRLESELVETGEKIEQATEDLAEAEKVEQKQYEDMKLRIKFLYEEGDTTLVETIMSAESFTDLLNKAEYVQNVQNYDRTKLQEYVETKQTISDLKDTLEAEQASLEEKQTEFQAQEQELNTLIDTKQAEVADLDGKIQAAVEQAAREEAARQAALQAEREAAAQQASGGNNSGGGSGRSSGGSSNSSSRGNSSSGGGSSYVAPSNGSSGSAIVSAAYSQLGVPYVWGGTAAGSGLDCSGLTQYCHRVAGISIPRTSGSQRAAGASVSNPQPGDIVCYPGHVGIYIGGGQMIHAPQTGDVVRVARVYGSPSYVRYW